MLEKQAKAPRMRKFKFPNAQAIYFTYLIKKYGDDYKVSNLIQCSFLKVFNNTLFQK